MSLDAMKQALEALELLARYENPATRVQVRKPRDGGPMVTMYPHKVASEAATALRAAIEQAQPQMQPCAGRNCGSTNPNLHSAECFEDYEKATGMAQPEQEPVAWMYHGIRHDDTPHERPSLIWRPDQMDVMSFEKGAKATPLYTAPRQWQRLTRSEITAIELSLRQYHDGDRYDLSLADFASAIEVKLKEKNT